MVKIYKQTERFNLDFGTRRIELSRVDKLGWYTAALDDPKAARDPAHPVEMSRHHIIPYNTLRGFWNAAARSGHLPLLAGSLMKQLGTSLWHYPFSDEAGKSAAYLLLEKIRGQDPLRTYEHTNDPSTFSPQGSDDLKMFYTWMPGNIFVGPNARSDDPGEGFDAKAEALIDPYHFKLMRNCCIAMDSYIEMPNKGEVGFIGQALAQVATKTDFIAFDKDQWGLTSAAEGYGIKT